MLTHAEVLTKELGSGVSLFALKQILAAFLW
jgi:hypothetical protein